MQKVFNSPLNRHVVLLDIGDFYATQTAEGIGTVVGSCITTCLYEKGGGVGGMNHFLIPGQFKEEEIFISASARIGMYAIELLMGELIKLNIDRDRLCAKIFGGGTGQGGNAVIADNNVRFIRTFMSMEQIPIVSEDLGGKWARKVLFFPENGKVMVKRLPLSSTLLANEAKYLRRVEAQL